VPAELSDFARRVLDAVDRIPAGSVMTYGDVAEYVGVAAPRAVGAVMARYGSEVPWHRVVYGDGRLPPGHEAEAARRLLAEGLAVRGDRVDLVAGRWDGR
jgi:methylated-DNA-protein-cysteine methyltransferase-like protein